jgi:hypothetical protein
MNYMDLPINIYSCPIVILRQKINQKIYPYQTKASPGFSEIQKFPRKVAEKQSQKGDFFPMTCGISSLAICRGILYR